MSDAKPIPADVQRLANTIVGTVRRGTRMKADGICRAGGPMVSFEEWAAELIAAAIAKSAEPVSVEETIR